MKTAITQLLGIEAPLIGFSRCPGVVREVSRMGGLGVFAAHPTPDQLDRRLRELEADLDGGPHGIDVVIPGKVSPVGAGPQSNLRAPTLVARRLPFERLPLSQERDSGDA
jgi:hypothetical protein